MVDLAEIGPYVDFTDINAVPDKPDMGIFGYLGADFRQNNTIGSLISKAGVQHVYDYGAGVDQAFTDAEIDALPSVYQPYLDRFVGTTKEGAAALRSNIDQEMRDKEALSRLGFISSLALGLPSQIIDPVNYIPFVGAELKGASLGSKLLKGAAGGVIGAGIQEPILGSTQETRTFAEMQSNIISSAAFGAVFGGAYHVWEAGKARWAEPRAGSAAPVARLSDAEIAPLKQEVHDYLKGALVGQGHDADVAAKYADLNSSAYASLAARSGADPKALAETFKVKITRDASTAADAVALEQSKVDNGGRAVLATENADMLAREITLQPTGLDRAGAAKVALTQRGELLTASGQKAEIVRTGTAKIYSGIVTPAKAAAAPELKSIVENTVIYGGANGFKYGAAIAHFEGKPIALRVSFEETLDRLRLYHIEGFELPQATALGFPVEDGPVTALGPEATQGHKIADLVEIFNRNSQSGSRAADLATLSERKVFQGAGPMAPDGGAKLGQGLPDSTLPEPPTGKGKIAKQGDAGNADATAPRGSIEFPAGGVLHGQSIIRLMAGADASTFMHESAHFFLEVMNDLHALGGDKSAFADDIAEIEKWAGARDADGKFTRDAHEKFARGFEQYLRTGEAPAPALNRAFEAFKEWLVQLYATAERLNADVTPEMARVYDRLLVPDVSDMAGAYPSARSVGAAATGDMAMIDAETGEYRAMTASDFDVRNKLARFVQKTGLALTPNGKAARSKLVAFKQTMASLAEDQVDSEASRQGAVTTAVETLIKNHRGMVEAKLYSIFGKNGKRLVHPTLTPDEFGERVLNALANPTSEADPLISAVADLAYSEVIKPLEDKMRKIGMIAEKQKWSQDGRYAPHNWSSGKILADLPIFRRKMGDRIRKALGVGYQVQIDKNEKAKTNLLREIDAIERGGLRRRDDMARRFNGDEVNLTEPEIRSLMMQANNKPDEARPASLRQFVVKAGGFWLGDPLIGEIKAMGFRAVGFVKKERYRPSAAGDNRGGLPIDMMRERAVEAGYLKEDASISDFLSLLDKDVRGRDRAYAEADLGEVASWQAYDQFLDELAQVGIYFDGKPILRASTDTQKVHMIKAIDALEALDAERIKKLREKVAAVDGEILRASQTMADPAEFDDEVSQILDEVQGKLTGQDAIWAEDMSITIDRAGPLKRRSIDVMRNSFSEFMDNGALDAIGRHMHRMIAEYELTKRFGSADLKHEIASIEAEAKLYGEKLSGADSIAFKKQNEAEALALQVTRDQLRGTHAKGQVGAIAEAARFMSSAAYMLQLGDVVTSSVSDSFRPLMAHGAAHNLRFYLPRLREGIKQIWGEIPEGDYLRSDRAGVVVERIASSRMMSMMDLDDTYHPNTKATRFSANLASLATRVSLMDRWNQLNKWISAGLFMDRLGEMASRDWDALRPADQHYLSINRISKHQWAYVADAIKKHGTRDRGIHQLNFERWADQDLAETVRAAMRKDVDAMIVTPGVGDKIQTLGGYDMTNPLAKAVLQYKSFWISGHEKIMLRAAQNPDAGATASGALMMTVVGMMIGEIKAFTSNNGSGGEGYDFEKRWADRNFGTMVLGGIDRAGIIPMWMEANNMLERGLRIPLAYRAAGLLGMAMGADSVGDPSSRYASRSQLGSLLGPSAGVIGDAVKVVGDSFASLTGSEEGISPSTITAAKRLIPFQNAPVMRELLNWWVVPAAKAMLEP